jgi:hypothetical protein
MNPLYDYIARQVGEKLDARGVLVWYDPRREFEPFVEELRAGPREPELRMVSVHGKDAALAEYAGSFFETRMLVEARVCNDVPERTLVYVAGVERDRQGSVLKELELGGQTWEPQLKQLARNVLRQRYTDGFIDELLAPDAVSYADLVRACSVEGGGEASILKVIFPTGLANHELLAAWLATETYDLDLEAKGGTRELSKLIHARLGLVLLEAPLAKLRSITLRYVLGSEFRLDLKCAAPASLNAVPRAPNADTERAVQDVARKLRASHGAAYAVLALKVQGDLGLDANCVEAAALGSIDTFPFEERALLLHCHELLATKRFAEALVVVSEREPSFWVTQDIARKAQWEACRLMGDLGLVATTVRGALDAVGQDPAAWVEAYATREGWHRLDRAQRRLDAWIPNLIDDEPEKPLAVVRRLYEDVCHRMAEGFTKSLLRAKWSVPGVALQTGVFAEHVANKSYRIAYFLVDALRYEMGLDLSERLPATAEVSIRPALGTLPSITPIGMAALMPGASASFDLGVEKDKLGARVDGSFLPDLPARKKHAAARIPKLADLALEELLALSPTKLQKKLGDAQVVIVRSQEIDRLGEDGNAYSARPVMESAINNLVLAIGKLARAGVEHSVVSADHGHLFYADDRDESMRTDAPGGAQVELHRRCWIGRGGATPPGCIRVQASELGYASDLELVFPAGAGVFKAGGDLAFHHGGPSLQELLVPVLTVRTKVQDSARPRAAAITATGLPDVVTNRIFSVTFLLGGAQLSLGGEARVVKPLLLAKGRQVGAAAMTNEPADLDRATGQVTLHLNKPVTVAFLLTDAEADVLSLRVVVQDPTTDAELYRSPEIDLKLGV